MATKQIPVSDSEKLRDVFDTINTNNVSSHQSTVSSTALTVSSTSLSSSISHTHSAPTLDTTPCTPTSSPSLIKPGSKRSAPIVNPVQENIIDIPRHNSLRVVIAHLCMEKGFTAIDSICLETLVEMLTACKY